MSVMMLTTDLPKFGEGKERNLPSTSDATGYKMNGAESANHKG